jgi:hypothetical protein
MDTRVLQQSPPVTLLDDIFVAGVLNLQTNLKTINVSTNLCPPEAARIFTQGYDEKGAFEITGKERAMCGIVGDGISTHVLAQYMELSGHRLSELFCIYLNTLKATVYQYLSDTHIHLPSLLSTLGILVPHTRTKVRMRLDKQGCVHKFLTHPNVPSKSVRMSMRVSQYWLQSSKFYEALLLLESDVSDDWKSLYPGLKRHMRGLLSREVSDVANAFYDVQDMIHKPEHLVSE